MKNWYTVIVQEDDYIAVAGRGVVSQAHRKDIDLHQYAVRAESKTDAKVRAAFLHHKYVALCAERRVQPTHTRKENVL